ncbi:MAG TPA: hypothetical protein VF057_03425 [Thermoanaerobaculia bacterium]
MQCHEIVISRAAEGTSRNELVAAARRLQEWAARQPGFVHRTLVDGGDGTWVDIVVWRSEADAKAAAAAFQSNPAAREVARMLDANSVRVLHGESVALD